MKKLVIVAIVIAAAFLGGRYFWNRFQGQSRADDVRRRVEGMLGAAAGREEQTAIGWWSVGSPAISDDEIRRAVDAWEEWARPLGLHDIRSWSCEAPVLDGEIGTMKCTVNDRVLVFRVVPRERVSVSR